MKEFKIGGKVTISENETYRIVDIIEKDGKTYYFACTDQKPISPIVFERVEENGKVFIAIEDDPKIIKEIAETILESSNDENLRKLVKIRLESIDIEI